LDLLARLLQPLHVLVVDLVGSEDGIPEGEERGVVADVVGVVEVVVECRC